MRRGGEGLRSHLIVRHGVPRSGHGAAPALIGGTAPPAAAAAAGLLGDGEQSAPIWRGGRHVQPVRVVCLLRPFLP
jgi:hypothetical protein